MSNVHRRTVDFLLTSMSLTVGDDGLMSQFGIDRSRPMGGIAVTVFFSLRRIVTAALFARQHGAPYLRALSVSSVIELLRDFVKENYGPIASETVFKRFDGTFCDYLSERAKEQLTAAIAQSPLFKPELITTLFPLVTVQVEHDYSCPAFFFRSPASLVEELPEKLHARIAPDSFPPLRDNEYRRERPAS